MLEPGNLYTQLTNAVLFRLISYYTVTHHILVRHQPLVTLFRIVVHLASC